MISPSKISSLLGLVALFSSSLDAQTTVYVPPVGAITCSVTNVSSATPAVVTVSGCSGTLTAGMPVAIYGTIYQTAGFAANGLRKIAAVTGSDVVINDIKGIPIAGPSNFSCSSIPSYEQTLFPRRTCARLVQLQAYTARGHPRVHGLDGPSGTLTAAIVSRAVAQNPAWAYISNWVTNNVLNTGSPSYYQKYNSLPARGGGEAATSALYWNATGDSSALAAAKWFLGSDSQGRGFPELAYNTFGCTETTTTMCDGRYEASDYPALWAQNVALDYDLVYAQLSASERQRFADMVLNDRDRVHNGLGMLSGPSGGCTNNSGTSFTGVTVNSGNISCTNCLANAVVGGTFKIAAGETFVRVASITNANSGTAASCYFCVTTGISNATAYYYRPWQTGDCGFTFFKRHASSTTDPFSQGDATLYPPDGGTATIFYGNNGYSMAQSYVNLYLALADDDPRAVEGLAWTTAAYYDQSLWWFKNQWTGATTSDYNYQMQRTMWHALLVAITIRNGLVSGPDYTSGIYLSRMMPYLWMQMMPHDNQAVWEFGASGASSTVVDRIHSRPTPALTYLFSGTIDAQRLWYWYKNVINQWTQNSMYDEYVTFHYIFQDPNQTTTDFTDASKQYLFNATDADTSQCATTYNYGSTCDVNRRQSMMISRTGNPNNTSGTSDTTVLVQAASSIINDHVDFRQAGFVHIAKDGTFNTGTEHGWLLGGDSQSGAMAKMALDGSFQFNNSDSNWKAPDVEVPWPVLRAWGGTDPTGDSQSRYAYISYDLRNFYSASLNLSTVQRSVAHLKKSGSQDYIIWYDYTAGSTGMMRRTFLHFWCPQGVGSCNVTFSGAGNGAVITSKPSASSMINTKVLSPAGITNYVYTDQGNGGYPGNSGECGGTGCSYRVSICAGNGACDNTATSSEWVVVNQPAANNAATMPTISYDADNTGNFRVIEVQDVTSPKVIAFGKWGQTYAASTFTTTHSATAQYLIAGLVPGTYNVLKNDSVFLSNQIVSAADNTLYFESGSGAFNIVLATPQGACDLNGDNVVNGTDVSLAVSVALGLSGCTAQFDLNQDARCDAVDVQRVVNASLGLGCKVGF